MLVTKKEVRKASKKALSLLLAVIMIMTSMSVCFGTISFAADDTALINDFVSAVQCDAMKNFPTLTKVETDNGKAGENKIIYKTFTYSTSNYNYYEQVVNVITKLDAAIKGLDEYKNGHNHNGNSNCSDGWGKTTATDKCTDLGWIERHLEAAIGESTLATLDGTYHLDRLFAAVFNMDGTTDKRNADNDIDMNDKTSKIEASIHNILVVKATDVKAKIESYGSIDAIPDNLGTEYQYKLSMTRKNYTTKSGCSTTNHYHFALSSSEDAGTIHAPSQTATTTTNKSVLTNARTTFETTYANYYNAADSKAIVAISSDVNTLTVVKEAFETTKNGVINTFNTTIYNKFFDEDKVDHAIKIIGDTIKFVQFKPIVDELNRLDAIDYSAYTEAQLLTHLTAFDAEMAKYDELDNAAKELVLENFDLPIDDIKANLVQLRHDYEVYGIRRLLAQTETHKNNCKDWTVDMIDEGDVTFAMATQALGNIGNDISLFEGYVRANVDEVCGADYMENLYSFYNNLEYLYSAAEFNKDFLNSYDTFRDDIKNAIAEDSETLLESVMQYDTWVTSLKTLINSMKSELGEEVADKLFDGLNEPMMEYIQNAYKVLEIRTETEVNSAYELLEAYKAAYGENVTMASVSKYKAFRYAVESINREAYDFLVASPNATISAEVQNRFNNIDVTFPSYEEFLASYGFAGWQTSVIDNFTRKESEDDIVREGDYEVTDAKIEKVIKVLDAALGNEEVGKLLGQLINKDGSPLDLGAMLSDLVKGVILKDSFINTVVMMLYPLVLKEFGKVFSNDLPAEASGQKVTYLKNLYNVFDGAKFYVYPDQLADVLKGDQYADTRTRLNNAYKNFDKEFGVSSSGLSYSTILDPAGGTNSNGGARVIVDKCAWDSKELMKEVVDEDGNVVLNEDGTAKMECALTWGVDAYRESIEADGVVTAEEQTAFENYFYNAADDALEGLKPLLLALIANKEWSSSQSGLAEAVGGLAKVSLNLGATKNSGYANLLVPIYEALGVSYTSVSTVETTYTNSTNTKASKDVALILEAILSPIFTFIENIGDAPLTTVLNAIPNICHALSAQMVTPLLSMLKTNIWYEAPIGGLASMCDIETPTGNVAIDVGAMLNINDLIDLSDGLNSILRQFGLDIPAIDQGYIATLGTLGTISTQRKENVYSGLASGKAYHITANKADILLYILEYALESGLLGMFMEIPADGFVGELFAKLAVAESRNDIIAALVEVINGDGKYGPLVNYSWFSGVANGEQVNTTSDISVQVYLNPENDWTEDKANYLYENIDEIVAAVLKLANVDLDATTEEVDGSIADVIGGIFSAETLTSIARLLGSISDINALIAPKAEADAEGEEAADPDAPATVAEGEEATEEEATEEKAALNIDVNGLIKSFLGIDLAAAYGKYAEIPTAEENPEYVYDFGREINGAADFAAVLAEMLAPIKPILGFILDGKNLEVKLSNTEKITLKGSNGYDSAIVPVLEALGCDVKAYEDGKALELTLAAVAGKIDSLVAGDTIKGIIDILPGLFYFLAGNNLATVVRNLLQPVYALIDTIRPIYDLDINELLAGIEVNGAPLGLDLDTLDLNFVFGLLEDLLLKDIDLGTLLDDVKELIYAICKLVATKYTSVSTLAGQTEWKRGELSKDGFSGGDLLTVILSFVLEWATEADNAAKLDELLGTDGIIASLNTVFASADISYGTPNWMYWFKDEAAFNDYLANPGKLETLAAFDWDNIIDNDWDLETAQYFAENIGALVDVIIGMINKDKFDEEGNALPTNLADLLGGLVNGLVNADTINMIVGLIADLLKDVDDNLLEAAGYLLSDGEGDNIDIVGLKHYKCEVEINSISGFINELANVLDTYASGLIDFLFFGDDYRFAKKSDNTDTIVINGGLGYEKGLALILEALGCELPKVATTKSVLGALATRVEAILANPVNEVLDLLPNLVYFLNANGAGVAVSNLLAPVNALLDKLAGFGLNVNIADLLKFNVNGEEIAIDPANLSLANVVEIVEGATGLDLSAAEDILVGFCTGKITKGEYIYKMTAAREDVITILLVVALELIYDDNFTAGLAEMIGMDAVKSIKGIIDGSYDIEVVEPNWNFMGGTVIDDTIEYENQIPSYPNDWTKGKAQYLAENLPALADTVISMLTINGVQYESLAALLQANVNIFTTETLDSIVDLLKGLLGGINEELLEVGFILDVDLAGLMNYKATAGITTVDAFATELAKVLNTYATGVVEWLLLGRDFKLVAKADGSYVTIKGANGYANGLGLLLEALGCENLPDAINDRLETKDIVEEVLASLAKRIDEILANPVEEVLDLLPNLIYFLEANGVKAVIKNTTAAVMAIVDKLSAFGVSLDIASLVDIADLMGIADKYAEGEEKISLDNLTISALLKAVSLMTGLDLAELEAVLVPFAVGKAVKYDSVSEFDAYKMVYVDGADKEDMITVIFTAALKAIVEDEENAAKLDEMLGTDGIVAALKDVFAPSEIEYEAPEWGYATNDMYGEYLIQYPNNWTEDTAEYVTSVLLSDEFSAIVAGLIDANYDSLSALLTDKVNVFTSENLQAIVDLIANLLGGIDDGLLEAAGILLDVNVVDLKGYKAPADITTVGAFAAELANVLNTYAKGIVEWLLLGNDYTFFVKDVDADGKPIDFITINGANGYANGLALLLEALGCQNLPAADAKTEDIVEGVLASLAARIDEIFANPVVEVMALLPNIIYFLNANGVAAVVENTLAAVTALLDKLTAFGVNVDIKSLVNLKDLMGLADTDAAISLDNLSMAAVLEAVGLMVGLDLTEIENVLVGFDLGNVEAYASVSDKEAVGEAMMMTYARNFEIYDMVTVVANVALITLTDAANAEFVKGLVGGEIYDVIYNFLNMEEIPVQEMSWKETDKVGQVFSAMKRSEEYKGFTYGQLYTETHAQYIADNFPVVVDNVIELLGLEYGSTLNEVLNNLIDGSIYKSELVIKIRDALAGVLAGIADLEIGGVNVGMYITEVLKNSNVADLAAVANVEVPEFTADKAKFVEYLCDVLEPLYPVLAYVLADADISFFVNKDAESLVTLKGAEGYKTGIVLLLEALDCAGIVAPEAYYAAIEAGDSDVLITSILNPILNKVDEILANPADEILELLPNLVYFINSNGLDTVVKNTLNAVYAVLKAIAPIAKIDLYELIGLDLATLDFEKLVEIVLGLLKNAGYEFDVEEIDYVSELTVGRLEQYDSLSGLPAYRMVYTADAANAGDKAEMVTTVERLVLTFLADENNQAMVIAFLQDNLGMGETGTKFIEGTMDVVADCALNTSIGMELALMSAYYIFYGVDTGVQGTVDGREDLSDAFNGLMDIVKEANPDSYDLLNKIFGKIDPDGDVFQPGTENEDGTTNEGGIAQNGLVKFFQKISTWFSNIGTWFKNLFSFSFLKR